MDSFEEDAYTVNIFVGLGVLLMAGAAALFYLSFSSIAALTVVAMTFIAVSTSGF